MLSSCTRARPTLGCVVSGLFSFAVLPDVCRMTARLSIKSPLCIISSVMHIVRGRTTNQPPNMGAWNGLPSAYTPLPMARRASKSTRCAGVTAASARGCTTCHQSTVASASGKSSCSSLEHQSVGTLPLRTHDSVWRGHLHACVATSQQ